METWAARWRATAKTAHVELDTIGDAPLSGCGNLGAVIDGGTYDAAENTLDATLRLTNGERSDRFALRLDQDDTGYFPLIKVADNGGCAAEGRLIARAPTP